MNVGGTGWAERRRALRVDTERRVRALQAVMRERGLGAALFTATAGPGLFGVAKYFTNLVLWYGRAYVVIGARQPEPVIVHWSSFQSEWNRQEATTERIETPDVSVALDSPVAFRRALEIAMDLAGADRRLGVEHVAQTWAAGEWEEFRQRLPGVETVDLSRSIDAIRCVKSPFELDEIRLLGELMTQAMERFARTARPGLPVWPAAAAAEEVLKAEGCLWGRTKASLNQRPATLPPPLDRRFQADDIVLFEIDYAGPFGYWYEMTALFSFAPLPSAVQARVRLYEDVIRLIAGACRPGTRVGDLASLADEGFRARGQPVVGMHLPHCHSIGLDETDGPNSSASPDDRLEADMVLAIHPGSLFPGGTAFLMSDLFRVTSEGGERLSGKTWLHRVIS